MGGILKHKITLRWSRNLAYAIGLITSDGNLDSDRRHIQFGSKDAEMIINFKKALEINNKVSRHARGGEKDKKYFSVRFGDKVFYGFLNSIGLYPKKSKTIKKVLIPEQYFSDFLRGLFDGDGTFYTFRDKRWPSSYGYQISFASASYSSIAWLKNRLTKLCGVKGFIRQGDGVYNIRYVKGDSIKLFFTMYKDINNRQDAALFLKRKYYKITNILAGDRLFINKYAGLAHR